MADLTITPANVLPPTSPKLTFGIVGEAVTAGMLLYYKITDSMWWKADALTLIKSGGTDINFLKMAMSAGTAGQPVAMLTPGQEVSLGAILSPGRVYAVSNTATSGLIGLVSDLVNTNYLNQIGSAKTTSILIFNPVKTGTLLS